MKLNNKKVLALKLDVRKDERGWLTEILRSEDLGESSEFGQLFLTVANEGAVKGNHFHTRKYEWFSVIQGSGILYIENNDTGVRDEIEMSEDCLLKVRVPPNHTHAVKNTGSKPLMLLVYISESFNPDDPDTFLRKII